MSGRIGARLVAAGVVLFSGACSSIGPSTISRDRADYGAAIGESWKQQTLLNIVRLRYSDFPMFMEISQVIAGYQVQAGAQAGLSVQNYVTASNTQPPGIVGSATVGATYIDRPTVIYAPLTGNDFVRKMMSPLPPSAILSLLQSGYAASVVVSVAVDSIGDIANGSRRQDIYRPADPQFRRLVDLLSELQRSNALQIEIERRKDGTESAIVAFPARPGTPDVAGKIAEVKSVLRLSGAGPYPVRQGGQVGKGNEISVVTRSMLQIMLEAGTFADVGQNDVTDGRATPLGGSTQPEGGGQVPLFQIHSGAAAPREANVSVLYKGRWFWIADNDVRSKSALTCLMLLFATSEIGAHPPPTVVNIPAN